MPVKRAPARLDPRQAALLAAADRELEAAADGLGIGPGAIALETARIHQLLSIRRDLTDEEEAEFTRLAKGRRRRIREAREWEAVIARRRARHPEESRADAAEAIILKMQAKDRARADRRAARIERDRLEALPRPKPGEEPVSAPLRPVPAREAATPAPAPAETFTPFPAAPRRRHPVFVGFIGGPGIRDYDDEED